MLIDTINASTAGNKEPSNGERSSLTQYRSPPGQVRLDDDRYALTDIGSGLGATLMLLETTQRYH